MEETLKIDRSDKVHKFSEKYLQNLEDKQTNLINEIRKSTYLTYKKRSLKPLIFAILFFWMVFPVVYWKRYRNNLPEWKKLQTLNQELRELRLQRQQRSFWKKIWGKKNRLRSENFNEINQFYRTLIHSIRQYNIRLDLFDYALDRQNRHLDPPLTVGELEQIELTFQRIFDELSSAVKLLEVAENHTDMDLATLLNNQYENIKMSSEFVTQTVEIGKSGQFVQELLVIESTLKKDIAHLSHQSSRASFINNSNESYND